jgi:hypothetical protein
MNCIGEVLPLLGASPLSTPFATSSSRNGLHALARPVEEVEHLAEERDVLGLPGSVAPERRADHEGQVPGSFVSPCEGLPVGIASAIR